MLLDLNVQIPQVLENNRFSNEFPEEYPDLGIQRFGSIIGGYRSCANYLWQNLANQPERCMWRGKV